MTRPARLFALGMVAAAATGTVGTALHHVVPEPTRPLATEAEVRAVLARPAPADLPELTLGELCDRLFADHRLLVRVDPVEFRRLAGVRVDPNEYYATRLPASRTRGLSVADLLAEVATRLDKETEGGRDWWHRFRVRGGQVVLVPGYQTPSLPGSGARADFQPFLDAVRLAEQLTGPPVSLSLDMPLAQAVEQLRVASGANIVLDSRVGDRTAGRVAGTFDDVRLLTALQVLADQVGLKPVTLNNVYYLTDPVNAAGLQKLADRDVHGPYGVTASAAAPSTPVPAGFVTDGYQYYFRPADLKPVPAEIAFPRLSGFDGFIGGGGPSGPSTLPGFKPVPAPPGLPSTPPPAGKG